MKKRTLSKIIVTGLLVTTLELFAQIAAPIPATGTGSISTATNLDVGTINTDTPPVTIVSQSVLFYNPATSGPSFDLVASITDQSSTPITFSSYKWYQVTNNSGVESLGSVIETTNTLAISGLTPGYHKYRVYGEVDEGNGITCQSNEYQDMIVFVLSPLTVTATANLNGNPLNYCANDVPTTPIQLNVGTITADYSANTFGYNNPPASDFDVTYQWFAVLNGNTAAPIDLGTSTAFYDVTLTGAGTYTFYVKVRYAVKPGSTAAWHSFDGYVTSGGNNVEIVVNPTPTAPTITITTIVE